MGIARSAFYDTPEARARDLSIVAEMKTICDEFEAYGYRRVDAELRHRGIVVNAKKIRRLMREHALNPRQRRRSPLSQSRPALLPRCDPRCLVPSRHRLRHRPLDRCTARCCCTQGRHRRPRSTKGLRASFRPWVARRNQAVVATGLLADRRSSSSASAGVFHSSVLRGLVLRAVATAAISSALCTLRSVPFGKY